MINIFGIELDQDFMVLIGGGAGHVMQLYPYDGFIAYNVKY